MVRPLLLVAFSLAITAFAAPAVARADDGPATTGKPNASEAAFVRSIQADLPKRFAHATDAESAGYIRYTNVDATGAISYANLHWTSADPRHPSQLWYDVNGNLLGADFSVLKASATRPNRWGIQPGRWSDFDAHIHFVRVNPATGKDVYDQYVMAPKFKAAGGDPEHPTASTLVKLGMVADVKDVATIFLFPTIWDLVVWVKPNPNGAFAEKNPLVTP